VPNNQSGVEHSSPLIVTMQIVLITHPEENTQ